MSIQRELELCHGWQLGHYFLHCKPEFNIILKSSHPLFIRVLSLFYCEGYKRLDVDDTEKIENESNPSDSLDNKKQLIINYK